MLEASYDPVLVAASIVVAIMAAFTCLRLTSGLRGLSPSRRKSRIAQAAVALGVGIWSMHFVGMLAVSLPVPISYDALPTLGSALIAILVTGAGFLTLHFGARTHVRIVAAGAMTGAGIVGMHYLGMSAVSGNCIVQFSTIGIVVASAIGIGASILALVLAYRKRALAATIVGAVVLGLAISAMHYSAMLFTSFAAAADAIYVAEPNLSAGGLAMVVAMAAFIICGLFLLLAVTGRDNHAGPSDIAAQTEPAPPQDDDPAPAFANRIPYQRDNAIRFLSVEQISAIRADGHYSRILHGGAEFFCPWPISRLESAIQSPSFLRTHRSYIVNLDRVIGFKRESDKGFCLIDDKNRIPVSRSHMPKVQRALGFT